MRRSIVGSRSVTSLRPGTGSAPVDLHALIDALLFSVSHDLRSPLLTLSLSADLLDEALRDQVAASGGEVSTVGVALSALRHGTKDLERMLQALTAVSRARRRPLEPVAAPLQMLLGGHVVISDEGDLGRRTVSVDVLAVREFLDATWGDQPAEIHVRIDGEFAILTCPPEDGFFGEPLAALASSLQSYAGTAVQGLATAQVMVERLGGSLRCEPAHTIVCLPLASPVGFSRGRS